MAPTVAAHGPLTELLIDRGYLGSAAIGILDSSGVAIRAKAWTNTNRGRFPKAAFAIDLAGARVTCPAHQSMPIAPGAATVHFAAARGFISSDRARLYCVGVGSGVFHFTRARLVGQACGISYFTHFMVWVASSFAATARS